MWKYWDSTCHQAFISNSIKINLELYESSTCPLSKQSSIFAIGIIVLVVDMTFANLPFSHISRGNSY